MNTYTKFKYYLFLVSTWTLIFSLFSLIISLNTLYNKIYPFSILFVINLFFAFIFSIYYLLTHKHRFFILISGVCLVYSIILYVPSMLGWPGGDDGPGIVWFVLVGLGSILSSILGIPLIKYYKNKIIIKDGL